MELKILEKSANKIKFVLEGDVGFANALRRTMYNEVPAMAIEDVYFETNTSGMFDEVVAHRLSMIPLTFSQKDYNSRADCKCEGKGCSRCTVTFVLDKTGPCVVKAGDLKSTDDNVAATDKDIPIVELLENHAIKLEATAQLGIGKIHSKWQASVVGYEGDKDKFTFSAETVCGLAPEDVLKTALDVLESNAEDFVKEAKKAMK